MEIQPNGNFEFHEREGQEICNWGEFEKYRELITESSSGDKIRKLEGLIIFDADDITQMFLTNEISIPDLSKIETIINEVETALPENKRSGHELANIVEEFLQEQPGLDIEKWKSFSLELRQIGSQVYIKRRF